MKNTSMASFLSALWHELLAPPRPAAIIVATRSARRGGELTLGYPRSM